MSKRTNAALKIEDSEYGYERKLVLIEGGLNSSSQHKKHEQHKKHVRASWKNIAAFICAITLVTIAAAACGLGHTLSVERALSNCSTQEVRVLPGQTMWALAQEHHVEGVSDDELVSWMREVNDLDTVMLMPGQRLIVPDSQHS